MPGKKTKFIPVSCIEPFIYCELYFCSCLMSTTTIFADLILPLALPRLYTYRVPLSLNDEISVGCRVVVPFGKNKRYTGIVYHLHEHAPEAYTAKYIDCLLDEEPVVNHHQLAFWNWLAEYYMCTLGEIYTAALPSALKLTSETQIIFNEKFDGDVSNLTPKSEVLMHALAANKVMTLAEIADLLEIKTIQPVIKNLLAAGAVLVEEELKQKYAPKLVEYVKFGKAIASEADLQEVFNALEKAKASRQLEVLMTFLQMSRYGSDKPVEVNKVALQKKSGATAGTTKQLADKEILEIYQHEVGRVLPGRQTKPELSPLSEAQQTAAEGIEQAFANHQVTLLQGVTSSGKTEIYVHLIDQQLRQGKQVLYLLPEIALTTQIIQRLEAYFGDSVAVYHSRFNQNERVELWNLVLQNKSGRGRLVVGARSAIFLPFSDLGLVIVDEEHETSFKQHDPAPRYNARDAAIVLAGQFKAKVLLGSATPSVESFYNAKKGKYGFVQLTTRFGGVQLPNIAAIDLKTEQRTGRMHSHFSSFLLERIAHVLQNKEQVILFQNRRGYSPMWTCETCGWVPQCTRCDVSTTYHKHSHRLKCHYCGSGYTPPQVCSACGSAKLKMLGFGTEKIEEELAVFFPEAEIARLDLDATRSKNSYARIIGDFEQGLIDILVGTQMVTKGLDFSNVSLVGILSADLMLNFPDFRASEKAFQLMTQVAGRAGRKQKQGEVLIQTYQPTNWVLKQVMGGDLPALYQHELQERKSFGYPPFTRLIRLTLKHKQRELLDLAAAEYIKKLKQITGAQEVLGPEYPSVARVRNLYLKNILIKHNTKGLAALKKRIVELNLHFFKEKPFSTVRLVIDVDVQ